MVNFFWRMLASILSRPRVADFLIERSKQTPYFHLEGYMNRWWLFNPTPARNNGKGRKFEWLPSIRIHHILRADHARDPHNHPWAFRTIILRGWYLETREEPQVMDGRLYHQTSYWRTAGDTATLGADDFHHVSKVSDGGVYTLFISWRYKHTWGFKTRDGFVRWTDYPDVNP